MSSGLCIGFTKNNLPCQNKTCDQYCWQHKNKAFSINIEQETIKNEYYRKVEYTGSNLQVVIMSLLPEEEIDLEIHPTIEQFIRIEEGEGLALIGEKQDEIHSLYSGSIVIVPPNTWHRIVNTSHDKKLKLYTIYVPANHPPDRIQETKPAED